MRASDSGGDPRTSRDRDFLIVIGMLIAIAIAIVIDTPNFICRTEYVT
jgi:hypothetical protein